MTPEERVQAAAKLLVQSPPGEINDCLTGDWFAICNNGQGTEPATDIRTIINDDNRLQEGIDKALREYNITQFVTFQPPGADHQARHLHDASFGCLLTIIQVIISDSGRIGPAQDDRFFDPRTKKSYYFDHLRLVCAASQPFS